MSQIEKLKNRLLNRPKDFTMEALDRLMLGLGYVKWKSGKTAGFKVEYNDEKSGKDLVLHSPHPFTSFKPYAVQRIIRFLEETGRLQR